MKQSQRIVKNAVFGIAASVIGSLVYLAMVLTIAHSVSVVEFGKYSFVLAFAMFFQLVADSGLPRIVIREIARNPDGFVPLIGAAMSLIWILSAAILLVVSLIIPFLHFAMDVKVAALLMSLATMAIFHSAGYSAVLRAFEDNELNYFGYVLHKVLLLGFALLAIKFEFGLLGFVAAHLAANILLWNFYRLVVTKLYAHVPLRVDVPLWKSLMISALPMGGGVILRQLAVQLDILILTWLTNLTSVGLFSGPYRISMALRVIPQTLALPLFPLFSRTADLSSIAFTEAYQRSLKFFALISFPIAAFFTAWSEPILRLALGAKYLPAIPAMQLLGIGMVPFFLSTLFQYLFAALDQERRFLWATCAASALRIILLVILVPKYGFIGPSIAFICSEVVIVAIWMIQLARLGFHAKLGDTIWRPLVAGSAMAFVLFTAAKAPLLWQIGAAALSVIVYGMVLFALKTFSTEEIHHAREGIAFVSPFIESWSKKLKRMKMREYTAPWAERAAKIWAAHWLLILGALFVFVSLILKWVDFPLSHHPYGLQLPLLRDVGTIPHFSLFSYGVIGGAILATGFVLRRRSGRFLAVAAAILIAFWVMLPCQIAFQQPALLGRLTTETQDLSMIRGFTRNYLPANYGSAEQYSKHPEFDTLWSRFAAACSFLGLGWYCFGVGSLLIGIYSIGRLPRERGITLLALGGIPIAVLVILVIPSLIGQHYFTSARAAQANGNDEKAIIHYRKAMWWDRWRGQHINIYAMIGDFERLSGSGEDSPEKHISKAEEFKEAYEYESALFELSRAAACGGPVAIAARHESARIRVYFGTALYHHGAIGAAVTQWQQAIAEDPLPQEGLAFLIARGNFDLGRYSAALDALNRVIRAAGDKPVLANAYSLAGDSYTKLGREVDARNSYNLSLVADMDANFWGMRGLIGN